MSERKEDLTGATGTESPSRDGVAYENCLVCGADAQIKYDDFGEDCFYCFGCYVGGGRQVSGAMRENIAEVYDIGFGRGRDSAMPPDYVLLRLSLGLACQFVWDTWEAFEQRDVEDLKRQAREQLSGTDWDPAPLEARLAAEDAEDNPEGGAPEARSLIDETDDLAKALDESLEREKILEAKLADTSVVGGLREARERVLAKAREYEVAAESEHEAGAILCRRSAETLRLVARWQLGGTPEECGFPLSRGGDGGQGEGCQIGCDLENVRACTCGHKNDDGATASPPPSKEPDSVERPKSAVPESPWRVLDFSTDEGVGIYKFQVWRGAESWGAFATREAANRNIERLESLATTTTNPSTGAEGELSAAALEAIKRPLVTPTCDGSGGIGPRHPGVIGWIACPGCENCQPTPSGAVAQADAEPVENNTSEVHKAARELLAELDAPLFESSHERTDRAIENLRRQLEATPQNPEGATG